MPYLEWIDGRPAAATYDLGSSDLRLDPPERTVVPPALAGYEDPPEDARLVAQVADRYDVPESEVLVTAGATHANLLAAATALSLAAEVDETPETGPQVLVEKPGYQPLTATPASFGGRVDRFLRPAEDGYPLRVDRVENALANDFAMMTVTNRHNPTGRLAERETLAGLARVAADAGGYLLVDEVYAPYVDGETARAGGGRAFGGVTAAGLPNAVTTGSLTKFHGLGGLRIGWLVAPEAFVDRARTVAAHVPAVAAPSRALARRAFHHGDRLTTRQRSLLADNHERLTAFVDERDDLSGVVHEGSSFALLSHESADGDAVARAAWDAGVLVVPGRFFDVPDAFRLSLGRDAEQIEGGLAVLGETLDGL
jgi:aspartate/methionine/tyrosine aminotransferase